MSGLISIKPEIMCKVVFKIADGVNLPPKVPMTAFPMYLPHDLKGSMCFTIKEMMKSDPKKFSALKLVSEVMSDKREPRQALFSDADEKEEFHSLRGLALIEVMPGFKYRCGKDTDLKDLVLEKGKAILLTHDCCLQFVPKDPKNVAKRIYFKARGFDGSNRQVSSNTPFDISDIKSNNGFSREVMQANVLRENCEGKLGEECAKVINRCPEGEIVEGKK